tara:strand:- start:1 stop:357 length:357 start_codon:yes stop_codon:yes gene_type:complete
MYNYDVKVQYLDKFNDGELYQEQFLKVFNIDKFDFEKIDSVLDNFYEKIKNLKQFEKVFKFKDYVIFCNSDRIFFGLLFAYHSFEYFHICLRELHKNNKITNESMQKLIESLEYLKKN